VKKLLLPVPELVFMALLLVPASANYVEAPANDNHTDLAQIKPIIVTSWLPETVRYLSLTSDRPVRLVIVQMGNSACRRKRLQLKLS
jgi:hypothetical protein